MSIKINCDKLSEISKKVFDMYYGDIDSISNNNLDRYLTYYSQDKIKFQVVSSDSGINWLYYYKSDMEKIMAILPLSPYMLKKLLVDWFENKYNITIQSPLKLNR
jgi:thiamine pyrophosphokinase